MQRSFLARKVPRAARSLSGRTPIASRTVAAQRAPERAAARRATANALVASPMRIPLSQLALSLTLGLSLAASVAHAEEPEEQTLRERLTEREDENRTQQPFTRHPFGHLFTATAQYVVGQEATKQLREADPPDGESRSLLSSELEVELFYSTGDHFAVLAQVVGAWERDLLASTREGVSELFVERGEMWLRSEGVFDLPLALEVGRLDFEDDRLWWWDTDLDAVRATVELEEIELALAVAREIGGERSGAGGIDPEREGVLRAIAELSIDFGDEHSLQVFALHHDDRSHTESAGDRVRRSRADDSDARLTWVGARAVGAATPGGHALGYWLDVGYVRGREQLLDLGDVDSRVAIVTGRRGQRVSGYGFDVGATWLAPLAFEPRLTGGFAFGSGDANPDSGTDRAYRQSGLHENTPGFGGVQRFNGYGILLAPELSNLMVATLGVGVSMLESSSIDLAYHGYWRVRRESGLRDTRLEVELERASRRLGHGVDLIIAIEEWDAIEFELTASAFRAGRAFGSDDGDWALGGFVELRFAF